MPKPCGAAVAALAAIVALAVGLSGCGLGITADDGGRSLAPAAQAATDMATGEAHDLAVTAIDFDPAWKGGNSFPSDNITLLVAVENRGGEVERDVVVGSTLYGWPDMDVLATSEASIKAIAPGESQVVRFSSFSSIPLRSAFTLKVQVQPVMGETAMANNSRAYKLEVTVSSR